MVIAARGPSGHAASEEREKGVESDPIRREDDQPRKDKRTPESFDDASSITLPMAPVRGDLSDRNSPPTKRQRDRNFSARRRNRASCASPTFHQDFALGRRSKVLRTSSDPGSSWPARANVSPRWDITQITNAVRMAAVGAAIRTQHEIERPRLWGNRRETHQAGE